MEGRNVVTVEMKRKSLTSTQIVSTTDNLIKNSSQHEFEENEALLEENYHELDWDLQVYVKRF